MSRGFGQPSGRRARHVIEAAGDGAARLRLVADRGDPAVRVDVGPQGFLVVDVPRQRQSAWAFAARQSLTTARRLRA